MFMEGVQAATIGLVGALVTTLLMWIRSDIKTIKADLKSINATLADHGQRLARIETILDVPPSPTGQSSAEPPVAA